ncbi:hypothetical protein Taro_002064 [Colocasia esculenta]|uniref:Uncharacterized protein n=1 Tax=Colocasia esculenta TaxID=4460 RepID=A0A843TFF7_COLES|nr:hypothetical protein [Colocasia esculenta]
MWSFTFNCSIPCRQLKNLTAADAAVNLLPAAHTDSTPYKGEFGALKHHLTRSSCSLAGWGIGRRSTPTFSRIAEDATGTGVATSETRPSQASRHQFIATSYPIAITEFEMADRRDWGGGGTMAGRGRRGAQSRRYEQNRKLKNFVKGLKPSVRTRLLELDSRTLGELLGVTTHQEEGAGSLPEGEATPKEKPLESQQSTVVSSIEKPECGKRHDEAHSARCFTDHDIGARVADDDLGDVTTGEEKKEKKTLEHSVRKPHFRTLKSDPLELDLEIYCNEEETEAKEKASLSSPRRGDHPGTRRKAILEALLQLLGTAQGVLDPPIHPRLRARSVFSAQTWFDGKVHINLSTSVGYMSHCDDALYTDGGWYNRTGMKRVVTGGDEPEETTHQLIERLWESITQIRTRLDQQGPAQPIVAGPSIVEEAGPVPVIPPPPPPGVEVPFVVPVPLAPPVRAAAEPTMQIE